MKLNGDDVRLPPKTKATDKQKQELKTPEYFIKELKKNNKAEKVYNEFSYSGKKDYIEWFEEAKTDTTREKRITQVLE